MSKTTSTLIGIGVALVLFFAVNVLATASLRSVRLDMTEEKLFTLSDGSRKIAQDVPEMVRLRLFVSQEPLDDIPHLKSYALRVREMLEEYVLVSGGGIELSVIDPEPYSEAESAAVEAGLPSVPTGNGLEKIYFGLVASNAVGEQQVIRFFDPTQERFLEYEISRLIYTLAHPERTVVGILSSLPLAGGPPNPMMPQMGGSEPWPVLDYLGSLFETRSLADGLETIPDDVDVLLLVHPKTLAEPTRYAIDQFVLKGGKAIVCVDPWCEADQAGADPSNPFGGMSANKSSSLPDLLAAWGVELAPGRIAADRENALTVITQRAGGQEPWPMVTWLGLTEDEFDAEDVVTSRLSQVNLATAGILRSAAGATTTLSPLMRTSEDSMDVDQGAVQFQTDARALLSTFVPRMERYTVAARVTGPAKSAFPDGDPDGDPGADAEDEAADEAADAALNGDPTPEEEAGVDGAETDSAAEGSADAEADAESDHRAEGDVHVIVIADADFLHERFWLQQSFLFGYQKTADNGDLLINAIENLAGGDDLIAVRGRGEYARPFGRVEEIRRAAEERYLSEERALEAKVKQAEERINELIAEENPGSLILTPEIEAELDAARATMAETNRQLRDVQYMLGKDIKRLGTQLKWINIGLLPALVCATAIVLGVAGKRRPHA